jgi:CheY-like chemotaxis protein
LTRSADELVVVDRLSDVAVDVVIIGGEAILVFIRRRQDHDGQMPCRWRSANLFEDLDASKSRHLQIEYVMLSMKDTGLGMSAAVRERIFEPFFTTKALGKGTGLGLSTVFGIMKQSRGHIVVDSEEGHGSTFRAYFPRFAVGSERPISRPPPPLTLRGSEVILLVEDDEQVRNVARALLMRYGYQVLDAQNGGEAFLACEKHAGKIDLLIADLIMPRMNGFELGERLITMRPGLKVVYMSGHIDASIDPRRVVEGGFPFIQKPIRPEMFLTKIREVLDQPAAQAAKP